MAKKKHPLLAFALFVAGTTVTIYCINRFISKTSVIKEKLQTNKGDYYKWKYGNIFYKKTGSGEPLLLIHDYSPYGSSFEWETVEKALAKDFTVYSVDLLGCGRSDKPALVYSNFLYVQMINDFVHDVIKAKTNIIATGASAPLAIMACTYDCTLFNKLVLVNPESIKSSNKIPDVKTRIAKHTLDLPLIGTLLYNIITCKNNVDLMLSEKYFYNPFKLTQHMTETFYEAAHLGNGNGKHVLSSIVGRYMNSNISHGLGSINNDILIIGGKHQPNIEETIKEYQETNPIVEASVLENSRFLPHVETPGMFLSEVRPFLDNIENIEE